MNAEKAAKAAFKKAIGAAQRIEQSLRLIRLDLDYDSEEIVAREMPLIRKDLAELNQRVHEFNAYNNASKHV